MSESIVVNKLKEAVSLLEAKDNITIGISWDDYAELMSDSEAISIMDYAPGKPYIMVYGVRVTIGAASNNTFVIMQDSKKSVPFAFDQISNINRLLKIQAFW